MMKLLRTFTIWLLVAGLSTPAFAGDLRESVAKATAEVAQAQSQGRSKALTWTGATLFVGGMAVGLYAFLNNKNGEFPEFGEAEATNKYLGTAGLVTAFVGGTVLFVGSRRASRAPSVAFGPDRVTVTKKLTW
jgi:hypothetical protein